MFIAHTSKHTREKTSFCLSVLPHATVPVRWRTQSSVEACSWWDLRELCLSLSTLSFPLESLFTDPTQTGLLQVAVGLASAAVVWKPRAWPRVDQLRHTVSVCGRCWVSSVAAKPGVLCWQQAAGNWLFPHPMGVPCVFWLLTHVYGVKWTAQYTSGGTPGSQCMLGKEMLTVGCLAPV